MKANKYLTWAAVLIPGLMLVASSIFKFVPNDEMKANMAGSGFLPYLAALGALELIIAILYIVPATRRIGFYLVCSYLGGAIAVHLDKSTSPVAPMVPLILAWIGAYLSLPNFLSGVPTRDDNR